MLRKAFWGLLLLSCALLLVPVFTYTRGGGPTPHDPIYIAGDGGFIRENGVVSGSGTSEDPYLIDGWKISMEGSEYGIQIENTTKYFVISDCKAEGEEEAVGIYLRNVENGAIIDCIISNNNGGIKIQGGRAIVIEGNRAESNYYGIIAEGTSYLSISRNRLAANTFGILFSGVSAAEVRGNTIELNDWNGIYVDATSTLNKFFHNNFVENKIAPAWDQGLNNWNGSDEGNYWDDYKGEDRDGDGIGDTPYRILGHGSSGENYDYYPLMEAWKEG